MGRPEPSSTNTLLLSLGLCFHQSLARSSWDAEDQLSYHLIGGRPGGRDVFGFFSFAALPADHLAFCSRGFSSTSRISHISLISSFLFRSNSVCPVIDHSVRIFVVLSRLVLVFSALVSTACVMTGLLLTLFLLISLFRQMKSSKPKQYLR